MAATGLEVFDKTLHLGPQLPLLIRGAYYDQWHPAGQPAPVRALWPGPAAAARQPQP